MRTRRISLAYCLVTVTFAANALAMEGPRSHRFALSRVERDLGAMPLGPIREVEIKQIAGKFDAPWLQAELAALGELGRTRAQRREQVEPDESWVAYENRLQVFVEALQAVRRQLAAVVALGPETPPANRAASELQLLEALEALSPKPVRTATPTSYDYSELRSSAKQDEPDESADAVPGQHACIDVLRARQAVWNSGLLRDAVVFAINVEQVRVLKQEFALLGQVRRRDRPVADYFTASERTKLEQATDRCGAIADRKLEDSEDRQKMRRDLRDARKARQALIRATTSAAEARKNAAEAIHIAALINSAESSEDALEDRSRRVVIGRVLDFELRPASADPALPVCIDRLVIRVESFAD